MHIAQIKKLSITKKAAKNKIFKIEEIKHFLRLDNDADNLMLQDIINSVISEAERKTNFVILESEWKIKVLNFSGNYLVLPLSNAKKILSVTFKRNGKTETLDSTEYSKSNGTILFRCTLCTQILTINLIAGCLSAEEINPELLMSMKQRIASIYENRDIEHDYFTQFRQCRI